MDRKNLTAQQAHPIIDVDKPSGLLSQINLSLHERVYREAAEYARGKKVLDWGCNAGYGMRWLTNLGCKEVHGVDVSESVLQKAREFLGHDAQLFLIDSNQTQIPGDAYDVVTSFECIEHVTPTDCAQYLREMTRVLQEGGVALFSTPNAAVRLEPGRKPWNPYHTREFTATELHATLTPFFRSVRVVGIIGDESIQRLELERYLWARQNQNNSLKYRIRQLLSRLAGIFQIRELFKRIKMFLGLGRFSTSSDLRNKDLSTSPTVASFSLTSDRVEESLTLFAICQK